MKMFRSIWIPWLLLAAATLSFAQSPTGSQEVSEDDGVPVILKHLPRWEEVKGDAKFIGSAAELKASVGERAVVNAIEFIGGTEAAIAKYPQGQLLIVEYTNPQAATDADTKIAQTLASNPQVGTVYRKIGNYAALVFDAADDAGANALLDQVKYEKSVQWLDKDPYYFNKLEKAFAFTATNYLVGAVILVVGGVLGSMILGLIIGYLYFRLSMKKRLAWTAYSDAGGLTRLNLDDLSEPIRAETRELSRIS